jgi:restriction endonuclease
MQEFSLNHLTDTEFEQFCYDLLSELKFINLNWRKGMGYSSSPSDRGRDIECQHTHEDIDGTVYLETWFVECKHYQQGVPPDKIQGALAWAAAERPDKLLIIASNFLSNPNKDHLESFIRNNKPGFRIKYWEKPDLERLTLDKPGLLRKYKLGGNTTTINDYAEMNFVKEFIDFEKNLHIVLLMLKIETPRSQFASVLKMWQLFTKFVGDIDEQYNTVIKEATNVRNKYVHGAEVSYTLDDFTELTKQLEAVSDFVRNCF